MRRLAWMFAFSMVACGDDGGGGGDPPPAADAGRQGLADAGGGPDAGTPVRCTPTGPERCNDADDDCDGRVDEAFPNLGQPCRTGRGVCETDGTFRCASDGVSAECAATSPVAPGAEACNEQDDDCDGRIDEDTDLTRDAAHCGACGHACESPHARGICVGSVCGRGECDDGWVDVNGLADDGCECEVRGEAEAACDGVDEDCDGLIDEDFGVGTPCPVGLGACVAMGTRVCGEGGTRCEGEPAAPGVEICNGLDDDCDGRPDEAFDADGDGHPACPGLDCAAPCPAGFDCAVACGLADCADDDPTRNPSARDRCADGIDQNCDGRDAPCTAAASIITVITITGEAAQGCRDLDGDGVPDNSLSPLAVLANGLIAQYVGNRQLSLMPVGLGVEAPGLNGRFDVVVVTGIPDARRRNTYDLNPVSVDAQGEALMQFPGARVVEGALTAGPGNFVLTIPNPMGEPVDVPVRDTALTGRIGVDASGLTVNEGVLSGVVDEVDLDAALQALPEEIRPLVRQLVEADIDLDADGLADAYSACIAFTAVPATLRGFPVP